MFRQSLLASALTLSLVFNTISGAAVNLTSTSGSPAGNEPADDLLAGLAEAKPTVVPTSVLEAAAILEGLNGSPLESPDDLIDRATELIKHGFNNVPVQDITTTVLTGAVGLLGVLNTNAAPKTVIYPKASPADAPYSLTEAQLRGAIKIPSSFTYGRKPPVILFPGTGSTGYTTYIGNFIKLLSNVNYADPVWVDVPRFLLDDAQVNSEYAAYAINYIASITSRNTSVIAWSQGNLDNQWALKYWPSTRSKVSDLISISPDFHGTENALALCAAPQGLLACTPSIIQQEYDSEFVTTLRADGGDSAYVPTTSVYSSTDEIVQPQSGPNASGLILDARRVGVSNTEIQAICGNQPAGGSVTHEGVLYNALAVALAIDALKNPGPGSLSRINVPQACSLPIAPGLGLDDLLVTENVIVIALLSILTYQPKTLVEPPIKAYAVTSETADAEDDD